MKLSSARLPTTHGEFQLSIYQIENEEVPVLVKGEPKDGCLVRMHSACFTGETLDSKRCDCKEQLTTAMRLIEEEGCGVIIYLPQEGRGIGLVNKVKAYALQDQGLDTVESNERLGFKADLRTYEHAAKILHELKLTKIRLLTNSPDKVAQLSSHGIKAERIPLKIEPNGDNRDYLETKKKKFQHHL